MRAAVYQPYNFEGHKPEAEDIVQDTWQKLGARMEVTTSKVFLRTEIPRRVTKGGIILPDRIASFYYGVPNADVPGRVPSIKWGWACAVGPDALIVREGLRIGFPRAWFMPYKRLRDGSYTGWIYEANIYLAEYPDEDIGGQ